MTVATTMLAAPALAEGQVTRTVQPGESLWWIAAVNGMTPESIAAANGLSADAGLLIGEEITVPAPSAASEPMAPSPPADAAGAEAAGMVPVQHPSAVPYLAPGAAASWEAMRQESLRVLGVDLYPLGPISGYRTWSQQNHFWELFQSGQGNPANPPGTSSHETGLAVDVATPAMRDAIDQIGAQFGWVKNSAPSEWWHVDYVGG